MVKVDTVYQRVLALANKEQRGYITPQEFNLFANQAQMEIFEQYFYDLNQFRRIHGNQTDYADVDDMLQEKLQVFERSDGPAAIAAYIGAGGGGINKIVPDYIYRINRVELNLAECEILNTKDFKDAITSGPLLAPSPKRPVVNIRGNVIRCVDNVLGTNFQGGNNATPTGIIYFKKPDNVQWGYIVINQKAMFDDDPNKTTNFELHSSEETELIYKILKYAGVSMKRDDIMRAGQGMETLQTQQEKQ